MSLHSISLSLAARKCVVAGNTEHAIAIAIDLHLQDACVTLIADQLNTSIPQGITHCDRSFDESDLDECFLVMAACSSKTENTRIGKACAARDIFCYIPGDTANSSWQPQRIPESPNSEFQIGNIEHGNSPGVGVVSLVGAGPGHPGLITVRAQQLIQQADAIVYDRLVSDPILALCNPQAEFVYAGKAKAQHTLQQTSINALLVELAHRHKSVVRLKGGDPFIFGRGGEEIETLAESNVQFQIVPGVTAASGCAAFAGIPLTHRDHAQSCVFVTGHLRNGKINLNWQELKDPHQTIVVYMGLTGLELICKTLIEHGRSTDTPAALVESGTKPEQRVLTGTLNTLPQIVADNNVAAPTMLIIGGVVSLQDKLKWH